MQKAAKICWALHSLCCILSQTQLCSTPLTSPLTRPPSLSMSQRGLLLPEKQNVFIYSSSQFHSWVKGDKEVLFFVILLLVHMFFQLRLFACMHCYSCCPHLNCMGLAKSKCMLLILKKRNPGTGEVSDECLVICPCWDWSSFHTCICWICEKSCMRYLIYLTCQLTLKKGAKWVYHVQPPTLPRWHPHLNKIPFSHLRGQQYWNQCWCENSSENKLTFQQVWETVIMQCYQQILGHFHVKKSGQSLVSFLW